MNKFLGVLLVGLLIIGGLAGCARAEFEVSPLTTTPDQVVVGEEFAVNTEVTNVGGADGTYAAVLTVNGNVVGTKEVTIAAGATETLSFLCAIDTPGSHTLELNGLVATVRILKPAELKVVSLSLPSETVMATSPVTVTAQVENTGEAKGTYSATLQVDGEEVETEDITVVGGEMEVVSFSISMDRQGTYEIAVGGLTDTLEVLPLPISSAVLTLEDFPERFIAVTLGDINMTLDEFNVDWEYGGEAHDFFGFVEPVTFEIAFGIFYSPLTALDQASFMRELSEPETFKAEVVEVASSPGVLVESCEVLPELANIGDISVGLRCYADVNGDDWVFDIATVLRDEIATYLSIQWPEEHEPSVSLDELARILDGRVATVLASR